MKGNKLILILAALSLSGILGIYSRLPASIPLHWNVRGQVDSWGPRWNIFLLGGLPLIVALLMRWLPRIDPKRDSYVKHARTYEILQTLIVLVLIGLGWLTIAAALGATMDVGAIVRVLVGLLFIGLGNFMGRLKRNYFVGIKTPWTLADDEVWRRTHRCGGWVFVIMGAVFVLSLALPAGPILGVVLGVSTIGGVAYMFLYSWLQWRKLHGDERPEAGSARPESGDGTEGDMRGGKESENENN